MRAKFFAPQIDTGAGTAPYRRRSACAAGVRCCARQQPG